MSNATRRRVSANAAAASTTRPPAGALRVDAPVALLRAGQLDLADVGAGLAMLAWRGGAPSADALAERYGITRAEAGRHIDRLIAAGVALGGAA